jgi:hypothetical protein
MAGPSKEQSGLLDSYISETSKALSVTNDEAVQEILLDLRKYILGGQIEIKNPQKTVSNIDEMVAELPKLGHEYRELTGQMAALHSQLNTAAEEDFKTLEASLRETKEAFERANIELKEIRERQPQLNSEIGTMTRGVELAVFETFGIPLSLTRSAGTTSQHGSVGGSALQAEKHPTAGSRKTAPPQETRTEPMAALKEMLAKGKIDKAQFERLAKARYDYLKNKPISELTDSEFEERLSGFEGLKVS